MHFLNMTSPLSNRSKTKLSVVSLLSYTSNQSNEKLTKSAPVLTTVTSNISTASISVVSTASSINAHVSSVKSNLPTVTNNDLLYKSVSSSPHFISAIPPLAPTKAVIQTSYIQPNYSNIVAYENNSNPLSKIRTLTNSVSFPIANVNNVATPSYIHIKPAVISTRQVVLTNDLARVNQQQDTLLSTQSTQHSNEVVLTNKNILTSTATSGLLSAKAMKIEDETVYSSPSYNPVTLKTTQVMVNTTTTSSKPLPAIFVPRGWNRTLDKDSITYISPNRSKLRNKEDLLHYLQIEGTCKCGLECPLKLDEVFDFNTKIPSKFGVSIPSNTPQFHCSTHKKFEQLFPPSVKLKTDRRGRKPGQKNKLVSSDENISPDKKRISLTGVSPLEMFQSGMNAINALSLRTVPKDMQSINDAEKVVPQAPIHSSVLVVSAVTTNPVSSSQTTSSVKNKTIQENLMLNYVPVSSFSGSLSLNGSVTVDTVNPMKQVSSVAHPMKQVSSVAHRQTNSALVGKANNLLFSPVLTSAVKMKQRQKKNGVSKLKGKGLSKEEKNNKIIRKALPHAEIRKASDLQLHSLNNQSKTFLVDQKGGIQINNIPSLRNISTVQKGSSNEQILAAQALLSAQTSQKTLDLQNLYQTLHVAVLNQQASMATTVASLVKPEMSKCSVAPNRTVSSTNHLNEAIMNQLSGNMKDISHNSSFTKPTIISPTEKKKNKNIAVSSLNHLQMYSLAKTAVSQKHSNNTNIIKSIDKNTLNAGNQPVNTPIQTGFKMSSPQLTSTASQAVATAGNGQMVFLHFVSQPNKEGTVNLSKLNAPLVKTYAVSSQSNLPSSQPKHSQFLVMSKSNTASQALQTLALQKNKNFQDKLSPTDKKSLLQFQNVVTLQNLPAQISSVGGIKPSTIPIQYVQAVHPNTINLQHAQHGLQISQPLHNAFPVVQYLQSTPSYIYPPTKTSKKSPNISPSKNFVRIAPGPSAVDPNTSALILKEMLDKNKDKELRQIQEELFRKPKKSPVNTENSFSTLTMEKKGGSGILTSASPHQHVKTITHSASSSTSKPSSLYNTKTNHENIESIINYTQKTFSTNKVNVNATTYISQPLSSVVRTSSSNTNDNVASTSTSAAIYEPLSSKLCSASTTTLVTPKPTSSTSINKETSHGVLAEEVSLHCDEKPLLNATNELTPLTHSSLNKQPSTEHFISATSLLRKRSVKDLCGTVVWVDVPGYPPWPGKILSPAKLKKSELPQNQVYVTWYGSHHIQPVNLHSLKPFDEGLTGLHQNLQQRKYRANKKQLNDLEKAIAEALEDVEKSGKVG